MPDWKAPCSFDRFTALLDFHQNVDITNPSHSYSAKKLSTNHQAPGSTFRDTRKQISNPAPHEYHLPDMRIRDQRSHESRDHGSSSSSSFRSSSLHQSGGHTIISASNSTSSSAMEIDESTSMNQSRSTNFTQQLVSSFISKPRVFVINALKRVLSRDDSSFAAQVLKRPRLTAAGAAYSSCSSCSSSSAHEPMQLIY
ncbi:unnamed protein product [Sphagnum troendelagicum]|uniref:Uncharacterized protein n=1 Tax=Sphagnum troendelagicum TaxID=128251 RepID=A0ABP0TWG9_9BRYO